MFDRDRQLDVELETDAEEQSRRLRELQQQAATGDTALPRAQRFIASAYGTVREAFVASAEEKARGRAAKYKTWIRAIDPGVAAVIALREVINSCVRVRQEPVTVQVLAAGIGRLMELEVRVAEAEKVNPVYMDKIHDQIRDRGTTNTRHIQGVYRNAYLQVMKEYAQDTLSTSEHIQLGKVGLQAVMDAGVVELHKGMNTRGKLFYYKLHPEVEEYLLSYEARDVQNMRDPHSMLMSCPPDPWHSLEGGGYLSLRRKLTCPLMSLTRVRRSEHHRLKLAFNEENMPKVFAVANYLQATPFSLHQPTVEAILRVWRTGGAAMGLPRREAPEKPPCPFPPEWVAATAPEKEQEEFRRWKRSVTRYFDAMKSWRGRVREVSAFLRAGGKAAEQVWCPVFTDTRNRWYYRSVINPQGSDLAKGALHFGEKKRLGERGLFWLKVAVASNFGEDKWRFKARAKWTEENWSKIEQALDAPEDHPEAFGTDAPWVTFAAAWELREALRSPVPEDYCTGVPVHVDATCSGLQHFCAMLRDSVGGRYVNLYDSDPTFMGPKLDIYGKVAQAALEGIQARLDAGELTEMERLYAAFWLRRGVPRDMSKKPVMTYVYGATLTGIQSHCEGVAEELWGTEVWGDMRSYHCTLFLAKALFAGVEATVPAAAECMRWLQGLTRLAKGRRMEWTSLTGFLVQHDYQDFDEERIKLNSCGIVQTVNRVYNGNIKPHQMANAISPNFVHNLDATHLSLTALVMQSMGLSLVAIHDSFGTHPSDVDTLQRVLREQFVAMYRNTDLLANLAFENSCASEPPTRGDLDLEQVINSEFFFC